MEVRPGYTQTEFGLFPADWEITTIGLQCQIFGRIGFRGYTVNDIVSEGDGAIAINPSNIQDGKAVFDKCTYISWYKYEESPEIKIDDGDIVLVKTGSTVGKTALIKNLPGKATLNPQMVVLKKVKPAREFLSYMMAFPIIQNQLSAAVVGGALPTLSQKLVAAFRLHLPPSMSEQRAIGAALSDVDALLDALNRLIAKKRDLKQAAMQQLLTGKTRLQGFSGTWEVKRLQEVATADWGNTAITKASYRDHGYQAYSASGPDGYVDWFERELDGVVISAIGAQCGKTWLAQGRWTPIKNTIWFEADGKKADISFLFRVTANPEFWPKSGQAQPFISVTGVRNAFLMLPPTIAEQAAIAAILSDIDAELAALKARRDKIRAIKQGMMQELLTGSTRLV